MDSWYKTNKMLSFGHEKLQNLANIKIKAYM